MSATKRFLLAILVIACPVAAEGLQEMRLEFDVPPGSFFALRFHFSPETDLRAHFRALTCYDDNGTPPQGFGERMIVDGRLSLGLYGPGSSTGSTPDPRLLEVGAGGNDITLPRLWQDDVLPEAIISFQGGGCWNESYHFYGGNEGLAPSHSSATDVRWTAATPTKMFVNTTWTRGFLEYDVSSGQLQAYKPHQFDDGAALGVTPPIVSGASVGALLRQRLATTHDAFGDWWPYTGWHPGGDSFCYENGEACPKAEPDYFFQSEGPTEWEWGFTLRPELSTPAYPLVVIELPDDSYLYD